MVDPIDFDRRRLEKLERDLDHLAALHRSGPGGTSGGMEARLAKVEAAVEHIGKDMTDVKTELRSLRENARTDFRILFGATISVAIGLAGLMAKGFRWI